MKNRIPPPILLLITGTIMWFVAKSAFAFPVVVPYPIVIAVIIAAIGVTIDVLALLEFRSVQTTVNPLKPENATSLVCSGIFSKTRNPMYLGLLIALTGWCLYIGNLAGFLCLPLFILVLTQMQILPEERILSEKFGKPYTDYLKQVRRWI